MATPQALVREGRLIQFKALIDVGERPVRTVFMTQEAWEWYCSAKKQGRYDTEQQPVCALLSDFVVGIHLSQDEELGSVDIEIKL